MSHLPDFHSMPELLDRITGDMEGGVIVLAGQKGMGKTALALDIARHVAKDSEVSRHVVIFSLAESAEELAMRMLAAESKVSLGKLSHGCFSAHDWRNLASATGRLTEAGIHIYDSPDVSLQEIFAKYGRLKEKHHVDLVIIDSLQLMREWKGARSKLQRYKLMEQLRRFSDEESPMVVLILCDLEPFSTGRENMRPKLADLPEHEEFEMDELPLGEEDAGTNINQPIRDNASVILLLYREEVYKQTDKNYGKAELIVAQSWDDEAGTIDLRYNQFFASFESLIQVSRSGTMERYDLKETIYKSFKEWMDICQTRYKFTDSSLYGSIVKSDLDQACLNPGLKTEADIQVKFGGYLEYVSLANSPQQYSVHAELPIYDNDSRARVDLSIHYVEEGQLWTEKEHLIDTCKAAIEIKYANFRDPDYDFEKVYADLIKLSRLPVRVLKFFLILDESYVNQKSGIDEAYLKEIRAKASEYGINVLSNNIGFTD